MSDDAMPCPLCGYEPTSGRNAGMHIIGHVTGNYTTGKEQLTTSEPTRI